MLSPEDDARLAAVEALVATLEARFAQGPVAGLTELQDLALRHLAKATGSAGSAAALIRAGRWIDACILVRALYEQVFAFLWVMHDPARAEARSAMVSQTLAPCTLSRVASMGP